MPKYIVSHGTEELHTECAYSRVRRVYRSHISAKIESNASHICTYLPENMPENPYANFHTNANAMHANTRIHFKRAQVRS